MSRLTRADQRWMKGAENLGPWMTDPEDRHLVYMLRHAASGKVRYFSPGPDLGGRGLAFVGPVHQHAVAATVWAFWHQWIDPTASRAFNVRCQTEAHTNSTFRERHRNQQPDPSVSTPGRRGATHRAVEVCP